MRIDDNERREVAKKLRNLDVRKDDAYHLIHPYDVEAALGLEPDDEYWFTADSVYRLADLIDRPIANEMRECNENEERRKIANRLRGLDSKIGDRDTLSSAVDELRMAVCGTPRSPRLSTPFAIWSASLWNWLTLLRTINTAVHAATFIRTTKIITVTTVSGAPPAAIPSRIVRTIG